MHLTDACAPIEFCWYVQIWEPGRAMSAARLQKTAPRYVDWSGVRWKPELQRTSGPVKIAIRCFCTERENEYWSQQTEPWSEMRRLRWGKIIGSVRRLVPQVCNSKPPMRHEVEVVCSFRVGTVDIWCCLHLHVWKNFEWAVSSTRLAFYSAVQQHVLGRLFGKGAEGTWRNEWNMCSERLTMNLIQTLVNLVTTVVVIKIVWDGIQKPTGLIKVSTADLFGAAELR